METVQLLRIRLKEGDSLERIVNRQQKLIRKDYDGNVFYWHPDFLHESDDGQQTVIFIKIPIVGQHANAERDAAWINSTDIADGRGFSIQQITEGVGRVVISTAQYRTLRNELGLKIKIQTQLFYGDQILR